MKFENIHLYYTATCLILFKKAHEIFPNFHFSFFLTTLINCGWHTKGCKYLIYATGWVWREGYNPKTEIGEAEETTVSGRFHFCYFSARPSILMFYILQLNKPKKQSCHSKREARKCIILWISPSPLNPWYLLGKAGSQTCSRTLAANKPWLMWASITPAFSNLCNNTYHSSDTCLWLDTPWFVQPLS